MTASRTFTQDQLDTQKQFKDWIDSHKNHYISTVLTDDQLEQAFAVGKIESTESQLRTYGKATIHGSGFINNF